MNCLLCYQPLNQNEVDYHSKCIEKLFGCKQMPDFDIDEKQLVGYAKKMIGANMAVTGVQPKLSLWLEKAKTAIRFTIVDDKSNFIIKPQSEIYHSLPENEDLSMHLAETFGIEVAKHGLVRLKSGNLAYITKRFDRKQSLKIACEDLCQLSESLTEHKYRGSYEKTGKIIKQYSSQPGIDVLYFYRLVLFCFLTGNADMHLKNFSMFEKTEGTFCLSPAYDLVSTHLVIKNEMEQLGLNLNGKKNKITKNDFDVFGVNLGLNEKQIENSYRHFIDSIAKTDWLIEHSFLPNEQKITLRSLISSRIALFA